MAKELRIFNPPLYTGAAAVYPYSKVLEAHFIVPPKFKDDELVYLAKKSGEFLLVPRELAPLGEDRRSRGFPIKVTMKVPPRSDEQTHIIANSTKLLKVGVSHILQGAVGFGKSAPAGTKVIMYDGSIKEVQNVINGDILMGPDSQPRVVSCTHKSISPIYKITPVKGESFECNDVHILSLKRTFKNTIQGKKVGGYLVNISVNDYLKKSTTFKKAFKLWRPDGIDFPAVDVFDPYIIGLYLADGTKNNVSGLTCGENKKPSLDYVASVLDINDRGFFRGAWHYSLLNFVATRKTLINALNERHIPQEYLVNSRENRLQLLAGILDGDGHLVKNTVFELVCKDTSFKEQVLFLCRSLGFAAYATETTKGIKSTGFVGTYWRICISGNTDLIPTKIPEKQATPRQQKKSHLVTGFTVEYQREDWVYGFELDKDHLYLLKDFTVTHNTFCAINLIANIGKTTLILVTKEDLMVQWKQNLLKYTDMTEDEIGIVQQNKCEYGKGIKVAIAMIHSVSACEYPSDFYNHWGLVVSDEVHRVGCNYFIEAIFKLNSYIRLGLTATPVRADGRSYVFHSHLGDILSKAKNHIAPPKVLVIKSGWKIPKWKKRDPAGGYEEIPIPHKPGRMASVIKAMGMDTARNHLIGDLCLKAYQKDRKIVIFFEQIDNHLKKMRPILVRMGIPSKDIAEYIGGLTENQRVENAKARVILGSYSYFSEGTDIPTLDTAILASPRSNVMQAIGRILRVLEGKKEPVIFDIVDEDSDALVSMHHSRMKCYNELKAKVIRY